MGKAISGSGRPDGRQARPPATLIPSGGELRWAGQRRRDDARPRRAAGRFTDEVRMYKARPLEISAERFCQRTYGGGVRVATQTRRWDHCRWGGGALADGHMAQGLREDMRGYNHRRCTRARRASSSASGLIRRSERAGPADGAGRLRMGSAVRSPGRDECRGSDRGPDNCST
jgi:hypothetical protein